MECLQFHKMVDFCSENPNTVLPFHMEIIKTNRNGIISLIQTWNVSFPHGMFKSMDFHEMLNMRY